MAREGKMMRFLLRVEAINIDAFINDTSDLSTARGGGLLLLDAVQKARNALPPGALTVSQGASVGLFSFDAKDFDAATAIANGVRTALAAGDLAHATFAVALVRENYGFRRTVESAKAVTRWHQMSAPSMAFPNVSDVDAVCGFDRQRPAVADVHEGDAAKPISASVRARRSYGRLQKQEFYRSTAQALRGELPPATVLPPGAEYLFQNLDNLPEFCGEFKDLTSEPDAGNKRLADKMAIFYADGNGFGKLQARHCTSVGLQQAFDTDLRRQRRVFLADLLGRAMQDPGFRTANGKLRVETLLWGGDELMLVLPAWRGWATMQLFFEHASRWTVNVPGITGLTHGAGLVFCSHKAPIGRIRQLAHRLADVSKGVSRDCDLVAYEVLESFDHTGDDLAEYRKRRWIGVGAPDQVLTPGAARALENVNRLVVPDLPRRLAHRMVMQLRGRPTDTDLRVSIQNWQSKLSGEAGQAWVRLEAEIPSEAARWFHLVDLLDYLPSGD